MNREYRIIENDNGSVALLCRSGAGSMEHCGTFEAITVVRNGEMGELKITMRRPSEAVMCWSRMRPRPIANS